ncbi:addiction module antidote protein, HigA family [Pseudomonas sp. PAMC 29040]|uniref:HigA family addiction module antitoxin n=1 Tax=Pseudomonas sp. PAMC 29040 TaxID=2498450 RepID=UPI000FBECD08|nr:HigA family addiction module antitoxin [Pseudomonas sp. PAMC 29040]RUT30920.1 addiction module antidote protein, HigA family [Pseudomonas sp. PAMC 29040]
MTTHNPPHPGEALREDVLPDINMTVTALAKHIGYSRMQLSTVLHCRAAISPDLAWRLELAGLGSAHVWLARQSAYDLWQAQHKAVPAITRLRAA